MNEFVPIAVLENTFEAQLVETALQDRAIPHRIRSFHDTAYDGLFQVHMGWGEVQAPEAYRESVLEIIENIRKSEISDMEGFK